MIYIREMRIASNRYIYIYIYIFPEIGFKRRSRGDTGRAKVKKKERNKIKRKRERGIRRKSVLRPPRGILCKVGNRCTSLPSMMLLIFGPTSLSLPIRAGTGGGEKKKQKERKKEFARLGNGQGTRLYIYRRGAFPPSYDIPSRKKVRTLLLSISNRGG